MPRSIESLNQAIVQKILPYASESGDWPTIIDGLFLYRRDWNYLPENRFFPPAITVVVQGQRSTFLGEYEYRYKTGECIVQSMDIPSINYTTRATPEKPFLSVSLQVDRYLAARLSSEIPANSVVENRLRSVSVDKVDITVLDAFRRLVDLLEQPEDIPFLAPRIIEEIHYRILKGRQGDFLRQVNTFGTQSNQIARAVLWLREHFREPLSVEALARQANMAPSTFYRHFKAITQTSPIQFQKKLRLHEAQRLMMIEKKYVAAAAFAVGYESAKQFSREYRRLFGKSPSQDIEKVTVLSAKNRKTALL